MKTTFPPYQTESDAKAILSTRSFGHLAVNGPDGPLTALVPFLFESAPGAFSLTTHLNRTHPVLDTIGDGTPAVLTCLSGDTYLSPDWYGLPDQVPTWLYDGVEARGTLRALDPALTSDHLDRLSAQFERRIAGKTPWTRTKLSPKRWKALLRGLVPVELSNITLRGLRKTAQAKPQAARTAVAIAMREADLPGSTVIAPLLEEPMP
jgi:transcriptional regulator